MKARYYLLCDRSSMMQKLGSGRNEEQVGQFSITFRGKDFGRQMTQHPVDADRPMADAEIQDCLSRFLQKHQGKVGRDFAAQMRQSQCGEMHSGLIEFEQQLNQGWLRKNENDLNQRLHVSYVCTRSAKTNRR